MHYVLLAISCSVLVSVLLKLAKRYQVDIGQAIAWNYLAATGLTLWLLQPSLQPIQQSTAPWLTWLALGGLLPTIFLAMAASVRSSGIVRSDAAQRLSLLIPLLAAFLLFNEPLSQQKLIGSVLGLLGLFGMVWRNPEQNRTSGAAPWLWPLLVFVGYGVIDVLFKRVAAVGVPLGSSLLVVFSLALLIALLIEKLRHARFTLRNLVAGLLLGACNFGNILFYLRAHRALPENPSLVFASMNLGVVALGTIVGATVFRERLSRTNIVGLSLAFLAIALLTLR